MLPEMVEPHSYKTAPLPQCASAWLWTSLWTSFPRPWPGQCLVSQASLPTLFFCPYVIVSCTHTYMHMLVCLCMLYVFMWKPEDNCGCRSPIYFGKKIETCNSPSGWALRPRDLPVSASPALGLQACYFVHRFYLVLGIELRSLCLHKRLSD